MSESHQIWKRLQKVKDPVKKLELTIEYNEKRHSEEKDFEKALKLLKDNEY